MQPARSRTGSRQRIGPRASVGRHPGERARRAPWTGWSTRRRTAIRDGVVTGFGLRARVGEWRTTGQTSSRRREWRPRLPPNWSKTAWWSDWGQGRRSPICFRRWAVATSTSPASPRRRRPKNWPGPRASRSGPFEGISRLDMAIDGADQVDRSGWLVKGGGGAHTREKIVATAADQFVVIVSSNKVVPRLAPPVPLELLAFGLDATLRSLERRGGPPRSGQPRRRRAGRLPRRVRRSGPARCHVRRHRQGSWSTGSFLGPWCPGS